MDLDLRPRKKVRGRTKIFNGAKTLDVAIEAYWSRGPAQVSVNEICGLAGVSKPSLYREFDNEDGLMSAALERYAAEVLGHVHTLLNQDKDFEEILQSLIDYTLRIRSQTAPAGCLLAKMRLDKALLGPRTNLVIQNLREKSIAAFADWLSRAVASEGIELPASVKVSAAYIDDQLTHLANRFSDGERIEALRMHANIAFLSFK